MISFQTNYASMVGEQNLNTNQMFQTKTIEALTSGYRINSSGDDAAGLAVANGYRNQVAELTQGAINGNSAVSQLQIMDGGLNNISNILDRLQTLATESASSTFTGNRAILNNEYQSLLTEINRQASNIGLNTNGVNATNLTTYIGGGNTQGNSQVTVNLAGSAVDVAGLQLSGTNLLGAGTDITNSVNLNTVAGGVVLAGNAGGDSQVLTFNLAGGTSFTATISSSTTGGITVQQALDQLNATLSAHGLNAGIDSTTGGLQITGDAAFTMTAAATGAATTGVANSNSIAASNAALYSTGGAAAYTAIGGVNTEVVTFSSGGSSVTVTLNASNANNAANAVQTLNTQLASLGINATIGATGTDIEFQSQNAFSYTQAAGSVAGVFGAGALGPVNATAPSATGSSTGNSLTAVTAVQSAVQLLGTVQGIVGGGENRLQYAISLANSQNTNIASAESQLRDADVATEAANLTKSQVLEQSSVAALAQANSAPQAILKLLQ